MIDINLMLGLLIKQDREELITAIQESRIYEDLLEDYAPLDELQNAKAERDEALDELQNAKAERDEALDELQNAKAERDEALEHNEHLLTLSRQLHEAICEGRKDDAIYLLREIFDQHFNDAETYARLFPGRVK